MIRRAVRADIPTLFKDGVWFSENVELPGGFDPDVFQETLNDHIDSPHFLFLIGEAGSFAAVFCPSWYGPGETSQEMWLRSERGEAAAFIAAWEDECRQRGICAMAATTQKKHRGDRVGRLLFERVGFDQRENLYIKDL